MDDGGGYDITRIGPYRISSSSLVWLSDPAVILALRPQALANTAQTALLRPYIMLRFLSSDGTALYVANVIKSAFGPDWIDALTTPAALLVLPESNAHACEPFLIPERTESTVVAAHRGDCTFLHKMRQVAASGASGLIVFSDEEEMLVPSADQAEVASIKKAIPLVLMTKSEGDAFRHAHASSGGKDLLVQLVADLTAEEEVVSRAKDLLDTPVSVNGHWLVNCRLVYP